MPRSQRVAADVRALGRSTDCLPVAESIPAASTQLLRGSDEPVFQTLRVLLDEGGVESQTAILADLFPTMWTKSSAY
jgi:hypothetical protein